MTDITEIKAKDENPHVSAIFDVLIQQYWGLAMETITKATLCQHTVENALSHILKFEEQCFTPIEVANIPVSFTAAP